mgnify:CR=1 FL=1
MDIEVPEKVKVGDRWLYSNGLELNVVKTMGNEYVAWSVVIVHGKNHLQAHEGLIFKLVECAKLISRDGVARRVFEGGRYYPVRAETGSDISIVRYDARLNKMRGSDGISWREQNFLWIGKTIGLLALANDSHSKEDVHRFNSREVEVGDVWEDDDLDEITISMIHDGKCTAWYIDCGDDLYSHECLAVDLIANSRLMSRGGVDHIETKKEKCKDFELDVVVAGDVWEDSDGKRIEIIKVHLGQYATLLIDSNNMLEQRLGGTLDLVERGVLISRGGVTRRLLNDGAYYPVRHINFDHTIKMAIRRYDASKNEMYNFEGVPSNLSDYVWIGKEINLMSLAPAVDEKKDNQHV